MQGDEAAGMMDNETEADRYKRRAVVGVAGVLLMVNGFCLVVEIPILAQEKRVSRDRLSLEPCT